MLQTLHLQPAPLDEGVSVGVGVVVGVGGVVGVGVISQPGVTRGPVLVTGGVRAVDRADAGSVAELTRLAAEWRSQVTGQIQNALRSG